jgi:hypothetical protein
VRRDVVIYDESIGIIKHKKYLNEIVVISKKSIDVLIVVILEKDSEYKTGYLMKLNIQVKTIVNIVTIKVLNIGWNTDG